MLSPLTRTANRFDRKLLIDQEMANWPSQMTVTVPGIFYPGQTRATIKLNVFAANAVGQMIKQAPGGKLSLVEVSTTTYTAAVQQQLSKQSTALYMCSVTGQITGCTVSGTKLERIPTLGTANQDIDLTGIYTVILACVLSQSEEYRKLMDSAKLEYQQSGTLPMDLVFTLADVLTTMIESERFKVMLEGGNISLLTRKKIDAGACKGNIVFGPRPTILFGESGSPSLGVKVIPFKELTEREEFKAWRAKRSWNADEEKLIPVIESAFPVLPEVQKMAIRYIQTRNSKRPMNNFLWRGTSGLGKSSGTEVLAALLGTPLLKITCFSTMETQDFLTSFVPCSGQSFDPDNLPSKEEMEFDPAGSYYALTGEKKDDATESDCKAAIAKLHSDNQSPKFKLISSNFIKALEKGYICEVQEMSRIKDQGVPVGLNEYDHAGAFIPKADGTFSRRHKDACVVYTDNIGYQTVHDYDPAVLRRMSFVLETREITADAAKARVRYNIGDLDKDLLDRAYDTWLTVKNHCKDAGIDSGICTVNELENFCELLLLDGEDSFESSLKEAVIFKATADEEEQKELLMLAAV